MNIELERCPQGLRQLVADSECAKCGTKPGSGLAVEIRYQNPIYFMRLTCVKCAGRTVVTLLGPRPEPPAPTTRPPIAQPDWYAHVEVGRGPLEEGS